MGGMRNWKTIAAAIARKGFDGISERDAPGFALASDIPPAFVADMVHKALRGFSPTGDGNDDLIELAMRLFEAMAPCRKGIARVASAMKADPSRLIPLFLPAAGELARIVEAAGLRTSPRAGVMHTLRLMHAITASLPVFLADDTPDLHRTLAHLAQRLAMHPAQG